MLDGHMSIPARSVQEDSKAAAVRIRSEQAADASEAQHLRAVQRAAFPTEAEAKLLDALQAVGAYDPSWSLLAEPAGSADEPNSSTVIGHCLLTAATLVRPEGAAVQGRILALGPIAVLPAYQRRGVGAALMREALGRAEAARLAAVVLLGHPTYYPRFGFRPARAQGLLPPADWPDAAWQAIRLSSWTPADIGTVHYADPFMAMGRERR